MSTVFSSAAVGSGSTPVTNPSQEFSPSAESEYFSTSEEDLLLDKVSATASYTAPPYSGDIPPLGAPHQERRFWWQSTKHFDGNAIATQPSVYDDPDLARRYQPRDDWENLHRFDPRARWTWNEEYRVLRKIDARIMVFACVMFLALELDRANISQAVTDNFLGDLGMDTNDYNLGNTVFKLSFLVAELPSQLVSKWVGPDRWIPMQITMWSIVSAGQFFLNGRTSFLICRSVLAILQGGFIPDVILYLSYFYKHHELSLRLGFFWTAMSLADIVASFVAAAVLNLRGLGGKEGWRWLFLFDGLFTFMIGVLAFGLMPASPTQTASWFRGKKGWFSEREEVIIINRVIRDDPSKGDMHNRQAITPKLLWQSICDYDLWPLYIIGITYGIPPTPPSQYLTLMLRGIGFDRFRTNLLVVPSVVLHLINMMSVTYLAEAIGELTFVAMLSQLWCLPFLVYLYMHDITLLDRWTVWAVLTVMLAYPSPHPIQVGWNSRNSNAVRSRSVSAALYNMGVQAGGLIGSNVYRADDAPRYHRGNASLVGVACLNIVLYLLTKVYYVWRNKSRSRKWDTMSEDEKVRYLDTTTDEGNKRLDFRFAH